VIGQHQLQLGDLLVTRNEHEEDNSSPGYWNHVAIYVGGVWIVEAQIEPDAVITSKWKEFYARYPRIRLLRLKGVAEARRMSISENARKLVGSKYWRLASLTRFFRRRRSRGENCVSTVRRAYKKGLGWDFGWRIPDDVANDSHFFLVAEKEPTWD